MKPCPLCKQEVAIKVIIYGLPMLFCSDSKCCYLYGFWSFIMNYLPFTGWVYHYHGSYWGALYRWVMGDAYGDD